MTDAPPAKLVYLTEPEPGHVVLNLDDGSFRRIEITKRQLAALVSDGARYMRGYVEERA